MSKKPNEESKERILLVAEQEFAERGFDGARVDTIAKKAGVNKALIYYYFNSKQKLLEVLYDRLVQEGMKLTNLFQTPPEGIPDEIDRDSMYFREFMNFMNRNRNLIRIILMESLKAKGDKPFLKLINIYLDKRVVSVVETMKQKGVSFISDKQQWIITEFFTGMIPMIMFVLFREDLSTQMELPEEKLDQLFIQALKDTHLKTHSPRGE
jgi:AcrR family transcriptional regulator